MVDQRALRKRRLENEYNELMKLNEKSSIIEIIPLGRAPYESYKIIFNIRTIVSPAPTYREKTICTLTIPPNYPKGAPSITANDTPYPWHINWYQSGRWCLGYWNYEESLVNCLYLCAKTLQFDPEIANPNSIANRDALPFWNANKNNRKVIPCDKQVLPILDGPVQIIIQKATPKIIIKAQTEKPKINIINR